MMNNVFEQGVTKTFYFESFDVDGNICSNSKFWTKKTVVGLRLEEFLWNLDSILLVPLNLSLLAGIQTGVKKT